MTKGRIAAYLGSAFLGVGSGIASLVTLVLAILGIVGWTWPIVCAVVALLMFVVAVVIFIQIISNVDETFEPKGIFGKFLSKDF